MLLAADINVANRSEFLAALKVVTPGDTIKLAPGVYSQGTSSDFAWVSNVHGTANAYITITAQDPNNPPVIRDNKVGLVISDSSYIRVSNLKFDSNVDIGLYIKGSRVSSDTLSPNHHIIAENITILNTGLGGAGNNDSMKIGATDYFTVQNVHLEGWGRGGGSAMDIVSSQYGLIQDSQFVHINRSATGSDQGVTMKGGSRDILVQNNFFHHAGDIAISIGQDTGLSFFRDPIGSVLADGSRFNYEAKDIEVAGNIFVGGVRAPIQFQKSSGGSVHHNTFARSNNNIAIIALSENDGLLRAHDGHIANNLIVYNWGNLVATDPFIGRGTATNPAKYTFGFENNAWYQLDAATAGLKMPSTSDPSKLLTNEPNAVYQVNPEFSVNLATANLANLKPSDLVIRSTNPALANVGADAWRSGGDTTIPNVAPSLTAAAANPVFTENGAAVTLYSGTTINLGEATDKVRTLVLTVAGLQNGAHETLVVDGRSVALTNGTAGITTATGINYSVALVGGTATVTLSMAGDMTVAQAQTLVDGLKYQNASEAPWGTGRTVTLTSVQDSGGTANGGIDTQALSIASAVTFVTVGEVVETAYLRTGLVSAGTAWTTVTLDHSYDSMVVVASVTYTPGAPPLVARMRNAAGNRFELQVQRADTSTAAVSGVAVQYIVMEEGVYTQSASGVKMEAVKFTSTVTDRAGSWVGQPQTYANAYESPVVLGQVMTANDPGFSVFWARGTSLDTAPSSTALYVGKHVAQDITKTRVNEQIGYIVVEAGTGSLDGRSFEAGVGDASVRGVGNNLPVTYALNNVVAANAVVSSAGMTGSDGGWAVFSGPNSVTTNGLVLAIDEDAIGDEERNHMGERIAYWAFGSPTTSVVANLAPSLTAVAGNPTFIENESAVTLYNEAAIDLGEAANNVKTLVLTVAGLQNGEHEILVVDGTSVVLTHGTAGTTNAAGIDFSVAVAGGTATVTLSKTGNIAVAQAQTLVNGLRYRNACKDPLGAGRTVTLTLIQDCGGTANGGIDTRNLNIASTVAVTPVNDAPSLTVAVGNPTFTENGPAVTLYSAAAIDVVEAGDNVKSLVLTVAGLQNGDQEILAVDGTSVALTDGNTGTTTATGIKYSVGVVGETATVTLTKTGNMTVAQAQTLIDGLKYQNTNEDPLGSGRTVTLTSIQDCHGTNHGGVDTLTLNIASAATVRAVNDAPSLTAAAGNPTFTANGSAVTLYSGAAIHAVEAADNVRSLVLTVAGLQNGSQEILVVDGTSVALAHGNAGTTSTTGINYNVAVVGGTATVTLTKAGDLTAAQTQTLVNGLQYRNASADPLGSGRTVTLTSIQDSGGTANGGVDARSLSIASTVTIKTVDNVLEAVYLRTGVVSASSSWMTVTLDHSYSNMVVVATPVYQAGAPPMVTRVRNAEGNRFELRVQRADESTAPVSDVSVQYFAVEAGVYTQAQHGVKMEAVKYNSTVTDRRGSWVGQQRTYANTYASPVVVGQVMTANDPGFSVFWARGGSAGAAPSGTALSVGKHVAEDPKKSRADEVVGYLVIEAGGGMIDGRAFEAGVGANLVYGADNNLPATYPLTTLTSPMNAVLSSAGMVGNDGGWAVLNGNAPVTANGLNLVIDEDTIRDGERFHPAERVAYLAFDGPVSALLSLGEGEMAGASFDSTFAPQAELASAAPWGPATIWNLDVTGDEHLTPGDVVVLINHLNAPQLGEGLQGVLDVNRDGAVGALDVLTLINHLNSFGVQDLVSWELGTAAGAEGESPAAAPAAANDAALELELHSTAWPIPMLDADDEEEETATFWTPDRGTEPSGLESVLEEIAREVDLSWSAAPALA